MKSRKVIMSHHVIMSQTVRTSHIVIGNDEFNSPSD